MKTVFFQGTFDILHAAHVRSIMAATSYGDRLIIGLNSDSLVRWYKQREPVIPFEQRREILLGLNGVAKVIECHEPAAIRYLKEHQVDVYVCYQMEWASSQKEAVEWMEAQGRRVVWAEHYPDLLCSTDIRNRIRGAK